MSLPMSGAGHSEADHDASKYTDVVRLPGPPDPTARPARAITASGYVFLRGRGGPSPLSGSPLLGGSQSAIFVESRDLLRSRSAGFELRGIARLTASGRTVSPDELALGAGATMRTGSFVLGGALERRTRLRRFGRDAFSARISASMFAALPRTPLTVSGYVQTGIVGIKTRDGFAEAAGAISLADQDLPLSVKPALGAWAAVQPGASRVDIGPSLDIPLAKGAANLALKAEWRFRVAGNATPGSGPALTISSNF